MDSEHPTSAEKTAAIVSIAVQNGASLCIPGALEPRGARPARRTAVASGAAPRAEPDAGTASHRERLEYELAGGGAAVERGSTRRANVIERFSRLLRFPAQIDDALILGADKTFSKP